MSAFLTKFRNPIPIQQMRDRARRALGETTASMQGRPVPVYDGLPVLGHILHGLRSPLGLFTAAMQAHGDLVRLPLALHEVYLFNHPDAYDRLQIRNYKAYGRGFSHRILGAIAGQGMLTAENAAWVPVRRRAAPRFSPSAVEAMNPIIDGHLDRWIGHWDRAAERGERRHLALDFMSLTSQIAWHVFFDYRMDDAEAAQFVEDFVAVQQDVFLRLRVPILPPHPRALLRLRRLERFARRLRASPGAGALADQTMTVLMTAPENPSNTLGWVTWLLAQHPEHADRVRTELVGGRSAHLRHVLLETMRLYPGGWAFERIAQEDDVVAGHHVPQGACIVLAPYTMHRNPNYWEAPDVFRPDRFAQTPLRQLRPNIYVPFGVGPRRCVGDGYTLSLVQRVLERFVARYRVVLAPEERGEPEPLFTLRSKTGIIGRLERV